ncbi:hypothetical protein CDLVIII_2480 [Clostridium sp. DL-VIII]|uniref:hypothetical protein n=1 Tax=Clostridium sp. DL-VIII TaxID=641107 RepID=UPI00023AFF9D|nr:hypothetical protein [Clostridium sp. DL-VIII]EHI99122.1 hypothetical protein CDLVIII_2480 [Clostridium sp. DL-VIII]
MNNNVNTILEKIKVVPIIQSGKRSIVVLSISNVNLQVEDFDAAVQYIWENDLVKILKVERDHQYITKLYADVSK